MSPGGKIMKKIINILLSMINGGDYNAFMKEGIMKKIKEVDFCLLNKLGVGPLTKNKKGMGFITSSPQNIFVAPEICPQDEGYVAFKSIQGQRGPIATSVTLITEEEIAKKIWEAILPEAKKEAERLEKISFLKKKFNINNFLGEITPMIKKLNIREENTYIYNLYLTYEYKNQDKIFIHLYDIEQKNNNFDIDVEIEGVPFLSIEKEDIPPSLSPLWKEIWREARKREKEKEEIGEEIHEYENEFLSEEPLSEEEYKIFINNLFGC